MLDEVACQHHLEWQCDCVSATAACTIIFSVVVANATITSASVAGTPIVNINGLEKMVKDQCGLH